MESLISLIHDICEHLLERFYNKEIVLKRIPVPTEYLEEVLALWDAWRRDAIVDQDHLRRNRYELYKCITKLFPETLNYKIWDLRFPHVYEAEIVCLAPEAKE